MPGIFLDLVVIERVIPVNAPRVFLKQVQANPAPGVLRVEAGRVLRVFLTENDAEQCCPALNFYSLS
jgi:hypothetical protein